MVEKANVSYAKDDLLFKIVVVCNALIFFMFQFSNVVTRKATVVTIIQVTFALCTITYDAKDFGKATGRCNHRHRENVTFSHATASAFT